jgi:hypothetical protein
MSWLRESTFSKTEIYGTTYTSHDGGWVCAGVVAAWRGWTGGGAGDKGDSGQYGKGGS